MRAPAEDRSEAAAVVDTAHALPARASSTTQAARRFWLLTASHAVIDVFPIFFVSLIVALEARLTLEAWQIAAVFAITPIFSGGLQPLFAWMTDRYDTRLCAPLGLALGAVCICSIGFAQNFWQLVALQIVGVIGTGMYHPISTALAGQVGSRAFGRGRGWAVSLFIAGGMVGQTLGSVLAPRVAARGWSGVLETGEVTVRGGPHMAQIAWLIPPSLVVGAILWMALRRVQHRHEHHEALRAAISREEARLRKQAVALLCVCNCLRFIVNIGLFTLLSVWAKSRLGGATERASELQGMLVAAVTVGMGVSAVTVGRLVAPGREKTPLVVLSLIGAAVVAGLGWVGDIGVSASDGAWWGYLPVCAFAALTAVGFFATTPVSVGVGQRLLPGHTGLASSLLMGVGWAASSTAPLLATVLLAAPLKTAWELPAWRINAAFAGFAALLVVAGALCAMLPRGLLEKTAAE